MRHGNQVLSRAASDSPRRQNSSGQPKRAIAEATGHRPLDILRKLPRLAHEWRLINRVLRVRSLWGECNRELTLNHAQERLYLEMAPQPLQDVATLILDTGLILILFN
jgi:hypothetical protein